jgi:hypothetical protein
MRAHTASRAPIPEIGALNSLFRDSPRREIAPASELLGGRLVAQIVVARRAGIRNTVALGRGRRNEPKRVTTHIHVSDGSRDRRHMTIDALCFLGAVLAVRGERRPTRAER